MHISRLLFLYNELSNPQWHRDMKIPLHFITFAFVEARMFHHNQKKGTFLVPNDVKKSWGNTVAYGALFTLHDFDFYIRILDAFHMCSMSTLKRNHMNDIHHRIEVNATPIKFDTLDDFARLKYREGEPIPSLAYFGNLNHPKITKRLNNKIHSHRIIDGVDKKHFLDLTREVMP